MSQNIGQRALTNHRPPDMSTPHLCVLVMDSYGVAVELSSGDELLNGFLDRA